MLPAILGLARSLASPPVRTDAAPGLGELGPAVKVLSHLYQPGRYGLVRELRELKAQLGLTSEILTRGHATLPGTLLTGVSMTVNAPFLRRAALSCKSLSERLPIHHKGCISLDRCYYSASWPRQSRPLSQK